jgi:hypothetical protein
MEFENMITKTILFSLAVRIIAICLVSVDSVAAQTSPSTDIDKYVWDLSPIFSDQAAWEKERDSISKKLLTIGVFRGTLSRSAKSMQRYCSRAGKMPDTCIALMFLDDCFENIFIDIVGKLSKDGSSNIHAKAPEK